MSCLPQLRFMGKIAAGELAGTPVVVTSAVAGRSINLKRVWKPIELIRLAACMLEALLVLMVRHTQSHARASITVLACIVLLPK